ncbi:MAG TPA: hypothetical protein VK993_14310 [Chthoniobacterales bacterium]|nr:hypothetical protein [Chthoniobacterales bacterium]
MRTLSLTRWNIGAAAAIALVALTGCGKHPLPEHTSEPRSHTYVFGERVGFGWGGDSARFRRYGWEKTEEHSTRTTPRGAALHFNVVDSDQPLTVRMKLSRVDELESLMQPVEVTVNGQKITEWEVSRRGYYSCVIPAALVNVDPVIGPAAFVLVDLHTPSTEGPLNPVGVPNSRRHGVRVWEVFMVEGAQPPEQHGPIAVETPEGSSYTYGNAVSFGIGGTGERYNVGGWDNTDGIFTSALQAPATLGFRVAPARGRLSLKLRAAVVTSGPRLQVQPVELRINGHKLADWTIEESLQWFTAEVPAAAANESGVLRVELATPSAIGRRIGRVPQELRPRGVQLHDVVITDES